MNRLLSGAPPRQGWLLLLLLLSACSEPERTTVVHSPGMIWDTAGAEPQAREFLPITWDTVLLAGRSESDTALIDPFILASLQDTAVVFDHGRSALTAFDAEGTALWSVGREGSGPGEFSNVRDLKVTADGNLSLLDMGTRRITTIGRDGSILRMVPLGEFPHAEQHLPLTAGAMLATLEAPGTFAFADSNGGMTRRQDFPWPGFVRLENIVRQGILARDRTSDRWVYVLTLGDGWYAFQGDAALPFTGHLIEHLDFPSLIVTQSTSGGTERRSVRVPRRTLGARSVALQDSVIAVLFEGNSEDAGRVVDYYGWSNGRYLGSARLPFSPVAISAAPGGDLFALVREPYPRLLRLRARTARSRG